MIKIAKTIKLNYFNEWIKKFVELNNRKPNRLEQMSFRVGFNAGEHSVTNPSTKLNHIKCNRCKEKTLKYYPETNVFHCSNCGNRYDWYDDSGV